jgi:hypothetical protein
MVWNQNKQQKQQVPQSSEVLDLDELPISDSKISPDTLFFYAYLGIQITLNKAIMSDDIKRVYACYQLHVGHLESVARGLQKLPLDYEEQIKYFLESKSYIEVDGFIRDVRLCNKKVEIILREIDLNKISFEPAKM